MDDTRVGIALVAMLVGLSVICAPLEILSTTESTSLVPVYLVNGLRRSWTNLPGELDVNASSGMAMNSTLLKLSLKPGSVPTNHTNHTKYTKYTNYTRREIASNQSRI